MTQILYYSSSSTSITINLTEWLAYILFAAKKYTSCQKTRPNKNAGEFAIYSSPYRIGQNWIIRKKNIQTSARRTLQNAHNAHSMSVRSM